MRGSCSSWAVIPGTRSGPQGSGILGSTSSSGPPSSGPLRHDGRAERPERLYYRQPLRGERRRYLHFAVADVLPVQNLVENPHLVPLQRGRAAAKAKRDDHGHPLPPAHAGPDLARTGGGAPGRWLCATLKGYIEEAPLYRRYPAGFAARNGLAEYTRQPHVIKGELGTSFRILLMEKRFSAAVHLLNTTDLPSARSSRQWVATATSYFYRTFQQKHGCTPRITAAGRRGIIANQDAVFVNSVPFFGTAVR